MKIKNRLAFNFSLISAAVLLIILAVIYISFYSLFKSEFYEHLNDRAKVAAQLYLEADEISSDSLGHVREHYLEKLPTELLGIYDERNRSFIGNKQQYWSDKIIDKVRKRKSLRFTVGERQAVGIYYYDNQGNFVILVSAIDEQNNIRLHNMAEIMLVLFIVINGGFFFIGRWFAKRSLSPIDKVIEQMKQITVNNLYLRVQEGKGKDEITELARYFNRLLQHLQNAFELQQAFVSNASHELRTPLTSMIGEIEISLMRLRTDTEYQLTLQSVLADTIRLNETITSLMELAQTDMGYPQAELSPVMIDEMIWDLHDYWNKQKGNSKLIVEIQDMPDDASALTIMANRSLLTIAFNNIIGNAFKFSNNQQVTCTLNADSNGISIAVKDNGIGIAADDVKKVFTSFYRSPEGREFPGSGIGLYVTKKIIELFNGTITIESAIGSGAVFVIKFPPEKI
jgi:signal transduction histidine kinase